MQFTTEDLASNLGIKAQSIRWRVCRFGSYFGVTPTKLVNGRLLWPADTIERLSVDRTPKVDVHTR